MTTYNHNGEVIDDAPFGDATQTIDPTIVKWRIPAGTPLDNAHIPAYITAIPGNGWGYGPTEAAIAAGKFIAAIDTVTAIPAQVAQQIRDATDSIASLGAPLKNAGAVALLAVGAFVLVEIFARMKK